jgi:hypothetical protein
MRPIRKRVLTDESMQPVAVQIEYADWLEIERLLGLNGSAPKNGSAAQAAPDLNRFAGSLKLPEDPLDYQRRSREEWK